MKRSNWIVALAVLLLSVGSLSANNIKIEWTGTVKDGMDRANIFGLGTNGDLTGKDFKAEFIVDPTLGFVQSYANYFATEGGTGVFGQPASPILSAILTINGESLPVVRSTAWMPHRRSAATSRTASLFHRHSADQPAWR